MMSKWGYSRVIESESQGSCRKGNIKHSILTGGRSRQVLGEHFEHVVAMRTI